MKKKLPLIVRCLLALILLIFGLNTFFGFLKMPAPPEDGGRYLGALMEAGFIFPAIGVVFIICAGLLATGRAVGLTLVMLAPICYNILAYHIRYDSQERMTRCEMLLTKDRFLSLYLRYALAHLPPFGIEKNDDDRSIARQNLDDYLLKYVDQADKSESIVAVGKGHLDRASRA